MVFHHQQLHCTAWVQRDRNLYLLPSQHLLGLIQKEILGWSLPSEGKENIYFFRKVYLNYYLPAYSSPCRHQVCSAGFSCKFCIFKHFSWETVIIHSLWDFLYLEPFYEGLALYYLTYTCNHPTTHSFTHFYSFYPKS